MNLRAAILLAGFLAAGVCAAADPPASGDALYAQGQALEQEGGGREAVRAYQQAARSGNGKAAKRLGEIYDQGLLGIPKDYAESLKWYNTARVLGEDTPMAKSRETVRPSQGYSLVQRDPPNAQELARARERAEQAIAEARARAAAAEVESRAARRAAAEAKYSHALSLEQEGRATEAFHSYHLAADAGSAKAAKRLAEIYEEGLLGVRLDPSASSRWRDVARIFGEEETGARGALRSPGVVYVSPTNGDVLYAHALALEEQGNGVDATRAYRRAAIGGSGKAAKRLGEIYDKGLLGIRKDYAESLKWYNAARVLGEDVPMAKGR